MITVVLLTSKVLLVHASRLIYYTASRYELFTLRHRDWTRIPDVDQHRALVPLKNAPQARPVTNQLGGEEVHDPSLFEIKSLYRS
jgi:hypothetical protein